MKSLFFNLVFVSILGFNLAGAEEKVESYHQSIARYFVDRVKFSGGRILEKLDLERLTGKQGSMLFRISFGLPDKPLSSIEIEVLEGDWYVTRTTKSNGEIKDQVIDVDGGGEVAKELRKLLQSIGLRSRFWDALTVREEDYFTSMLDGGVVLFEVAESETYRSVALCGLDFTAPSDVDFLRNLEPYRKLLRLLNDL